ncbi:hypothetical protein A3I57_02660 [Candidatus Beckwithbacteria bacterium RIFCSPLOWO2_02_FULL_47_23]|uniref:Uncharacterized protein n=1 Tax=Candidatus Beckwithbacteria bacterium RIFCSPLOWO2_02_FULL_47_23 TaxID=1797463 RepID=A0A1F5E2N9_9BACT|nr:MAG: hypothetical protein A3I57_02660 [Candidatus Beckwithbacteria bacterium RIFCSPLOWO2_02_FULL_47_23]
MLPDFKINRRIPEARQVDFISSPDWPKVQELYQEYEPWKQALTNGEILAHTAIEYSIILFSHGFQARGEGNYGIAAMTIWRPGVRVDADGKITLRPADEKLRLPEIAVFKPELANKFVEMMVIGHNSLFRQKKSNGHAERQSAEKTANIWLHIPDENVDSYMAELETKDELTFREAPDITPGVGLVTTLEPCPGCSEMIITAGYDWVLSLNEDKSHGALHPDRIGGLGSGWLELAEKSGINILFSQEDDTANQMTYLPKNLATLVARLFFETRTELDTKIGEGGVFKQIPGVKQKP